MNAIRKAGGLLLGAALLAGCSDRKALTVPSARPLAGTAALVDRPYTWSFKCNGHWTIIAQLYWTENGRAIASRGAHGGADKTLSPTGVGPAKPNSVTPHREEKAQSWSY